MSAEVLTIVVSAIGVAATLLGGMLSGARFLLSRMDQRFAVSEKRIDERFARVDEQLANLQGQIVDLRSEVHTVAADVVDLRIAVARVEGPKPQLLPVR